VTIDADLLRESFALIAQREPHLTRRFYDNLFATHPQLRRLFDPRRRGRQEKMLAEALVAVLWHLEEPDWLAGQLGALGAKHVGYGVESEMYDAVGECLLMTLGEVAGEDWRPPVRAAWTEAFGAIRDLMLAGAAEAERPMVAGA